MMTTGGIKQPKSRRWLLLILALALILRLVYVLSQDHMALYSGTGGDSGWYLVNSYGLVANRLPEGTPYGLAPLPCAPLYLIYLGISQVLFSPLAAIVVIRIGQALLGTATCYFAYRIGRQVSRDERIGLVAAAVMAISPVFVVETAQITTETLYIFFAMAALTAYVDWLTDPDAPRYRVVVLIGTLLGLATLTRAVLLLFPLGLALHLLLIDQRGSWRLRLKQAGLLLLVYTLLASAWTIHNLARWNKLVIGAQGFAGLLFVGAEESGWTGPQAVDRSLDTFKVPENPGSVEGFTIPDQAFINGAAQTIRSDPFGYLARRVGDLVEAYVQPHGTTIYPGESLKQMASDWLQKDRSLGGLLALTRGDYFWPKLVIYIFHYVGLIGGVVGMWVCRRRWRIALPLIGYILYTSLIHLVLDAIPRYIFPTEVCWWIFASVTLVALVDRLTAVRHSRAAISTQSAIIESR